MLTASFLSTLAGVYLPGERSLIQSIESKFVNPVYVGDELTIRGIILALNDTVKQIEIKGYFPESKIFFTIFSTLCSFEKSAWIGTILSPYTFRIEFNSLTEVL